MKMHGINLLYQSSCYYAKQTYSKRYIYDNCLLPIFPFYKVYYMKYKKILGLILIFLIVSAAEVNNNDHKQYLEAQQAKKQVTTPTIDVQVPSNNKPLSIKGPTIDDFADDKDIKQIIVSIAKVVPKLDSKDESQGLNITSKKLKGSDKKGQILKENIRSPIQNLEKQTRIEIEEQKSNNPIQESLRKDKVNNLSKQSENKKIDDKLKTQAIQEKIQRQNNPKVQQSKPKESKLLKTVQKHDQQQSKNIKLPEKKQQKPLQSINSKDQVKSAQQDKKNTLTENKHIASKTVAPKDEQNQDQKQAFLQSKTQEISKNVKVDSASKTQIQIKDSIVQNQPSKPTNKVDQVKTPQNQIKIIPLQQQQTETQEEQQVVEKKVKSSKTTQENKEKTKEQQTLKKKVVKQKIKETQNKQQPKDKKEQTKEKKLQTIKEEKIKPSIDQSKQSIKISEKLPQPTKKTQQIQKVEKKKQIPQTKVQVSSIPILQQKKVKKQIVKIEQTSEKIVFIKEKQSDTKQIFMNGNKARQIQKAEPKQKTKTAESKEKDIQIQINNSPPSIKQSKIIDIYEQKTRVKVAQTKLNPIVALPSKAQQKQPNLKQLLKEVKLDMNQKAKQNIIKHLQDQIKLSQQRDKLKVGSSQPSEKKEKQQHLKQEQSQNPVVKQEKQTSSQQIMDTPTIMAIIILTFIISIPIFREIKLKPPITQKSPQKESNEPASFAAQQSNQRFGMQFSDLDNQTGCAIGEPIDQYQR